MDYKEIKTIEDAFKARNIDPEKMPDVYMIYNEYGEYLTNMYKLLIVVEAINDGWVADFSNGDQRKYFPYFYIEPGYVAGSGGGFSCGGYDFDCSVSDVGARLSFESWEKAEYAGKQFAELYEKLHLIF